MRVLAIGCHPDDAEFGCFGTLARCVARGDEVFVCGVTNGSGGSMTLEPDEIAAIRVKEAEAAAKAIGAKEYFNLGVYDLYVDSNDRATIDKLVDVIRYTKPDMIFTQYHEDYMRDHTETSLLAFNASFIATIPNYKTKHPVLETVPAIFYMESEGISDFRPTEYVDISDTIELKTKALQCHESQYGWLSAHTGNDAFAASHAKNQFRGKQCGTEYAECFSRCMLSQRVNTYRMLPEGR